MTLWRIYRWIRKVYTLLVALAVLSGIGPGALPSVPAAPSVAPAVPVYPAPAPVPKKVIGSCSTMSDGKQWAASCVVDGQQTAVPGSFSSHAAAVAAIQAYRAANG
jgi:hypothetical protein